jgi:hypothetical protein
MSQVSSITIEYEGFQATIWLPGRDADKVVLAQVTDSPLTLHTECEVTPCDDLNGLPTWSLGATGPGREMA